MSKQKTEQIIKVLPAALKNIGSYLKDNFDTAGQDILSNATGTTGIMIKLFAQGAIDSYFNKISENKLKDFGVDTYLQAALLQVGKSLETISLPNESKSIESLLIDTLKVNNDSFTTDNILTIFTPQYHPIVLFVKERIDKTLELLNVPDDEIKIFISDFNSKIESTIIETFGSEDYDKHKENIKEFLFQERESKLLWEMYQLRKIGFKNNETLKYEKTFASWKPVSIVLDKEEKEDIIGIEEHEKIEKELVPIEDLIETYFHNCSSCSNCLNNILFTIADFGKGKSVFLRQYASRLAKEYIETKEGYIPIYLNLRDFSRYSSDGKLGLLGNYLLDIYAIRIDDDYFQNKKYIFLLDSLDESGDLIKSKIDKVIGSIKKIQNIDKEKYRDNRIIISSRPFSDGLEDQLLAHSPHLIKNGKREEIPQFISLYGFKEEQFNDWLYDTLKNDNDIENITSTGFVKEIIESINKSKMINIYQKLFDEKTLSRTELRRPIFSYMIYQLIINNINFIEIGKIGVYLSFINLLTRKAKHINDKSSSIKQDEELRYRNILHSISALWMYEQQYGKQGTLKKADICRVLDEEDQKESDKEILERYKKEGVTEIEFMSHSYFGEENNNLHFQHQSFAEILLAEYYLKVFIKYGLEKKSNIDEARSKLILGKPTEQTILFFKELLILLKDTVSNQIDKRTLEKRKLLYPLLASLSTEKHNTLYSSYIDLTWFSTVEKDNSSAVVPPELLEKWVITQEKLNLIISFSSQVLDSNTTILFANSNTRNSLFKRELTVFQNKQISAFPTDIDKWLSLLVGNILYSKNIQEKLFFNRELENPNNLFEMIRNWNYSNNRSSPYWAREYFDGIKMNNTDIINLNNLDLSELNLSYSNLQCISMINSSLNSTNFTGCAFNTLDLSKSQLSHTKFDDIQSIEDLDLSMSSISQYIYLPYQLVNAIENMSDDLYSGTSNFGADKTIFNTHLNQNHLYFVFETIKGFLVYGLKNNFFDIKEIKSWFDYGSNDSRTMFEKLIDSL